jgi:1-acyl-sn-glycerol-3-phosphate acyltransferase
VIYELMGLSGQEYVDIYAASVKDGSNAEDANPGAAPGSNDAARIPETAAG